MTGCSKIEVLDGAATPPPLDGRRKAFHRPGDL